MFYLIETDTQFHILQSKMAKLEYLSTTLKVIQVSFKVMVVALFFTKAHPKPLKN